MAEKSKILIIGGTGQMGRSLVEASAKAGHPTFALVRESAVSDPVKAKLIDSFKSSGVTLIYGDMCDHECLVKAIKQVDVVISAVGFLQLADQLKIVAAIKEAGNVKILPFEFGNDADRSQGVDPVKSAYAIKSQVRRAIETQGIPYTYVVAGCFSSFYLPNLAQLGLTAPPRDKIVIIGDGTPKAIFNDEHDIAAYTIKAVDDPRTVNKILYVNPPKNIYSHNDLVSLWEKKIGNKLEKTYLSEEELVKQIQGIAVQCSAEASIPLNVILSINHSVFIGGYNANYEIDPSYEVEAAKLYPDVKYTTVEEYLQQFV